MDTVEAVPEQVMDLMYLMYLMDTVEAVPEQVMDLMYLMYLMDLMDPMGPVPHRPCTS